MPLIEYPRVSQEKKGFRRLFSDPLFDLYLWYDKQGGSLIGFQLVMKDEYHAFTWEPDKGGIYSAVMKRGTPFLVANGSMPKDRWLEEFRSRSLNLDPDIKALVDQELDSYRN